ncbi:protein-S-isoprenylcysteine O-methyltransferase, partial [Lecanoromycetidae sp. Uapishka_2]
MATSATSSSGPGSVRRTPLDVWETHTDHANGHTPQADSYANGHATTGLASNDSSSTASNFDSDRAPAAVSLRAFLLGATFSASLVTTLYLTSFTPLWRLPFFLCSLSVFHFLEYYTTALFNPSAATISAFLLSSNGKAYNIAHGMAFLECKEENLLIDFFGEDYVAYRTRTRVGIPFIS